MMHRFLSKIPQVFFLVFFVLVSVTPGLAVSRMKRLDHTLNTVFCRTICTRVGCLCRETFEMCKQCKPLGKRVSGCFRVKEGEPKWCFIAFSKFVGAGVGGSISGAMTGIEYAAPGGVTGGAIGGVAGGVIGYTFAKAFGAPVDLATLGVSSMATAVPGVGIGSAIGTSVGVVVGALTGTLMGASKGVKKGTSAGHSLSKQITNLTSGVCGLFKLGHQKPPTNLLSMFCNMVRVAKESRDGKIQIPVGKPDQATSTVQPQPEANPQPTSKP